MRRLRDKAKTTPTAKEKTRKTEWGNCAVLHTPAFILVRLVKKYNYKLTVAGVGFPFSQKTPFLYVWFSYTFLFRPQLVFRNTRQDIVYVV